MFKKIDILLDKWGKTYPWTNMYGIARSIIALSSMLTLLFNPAEILFKPSAGTESFPACSTGFSAFCLGQNDYFYLNIIRWIFIILLFLVVIGWRPRFTGVIHWYISYSMQNAFVVIDGGEQAAAVITFLLIPITLTDSRKWHWEKHNDDSLPKSLSEKTIVYLSHFFIRIQVAILYFHSTVAKLKVQEWIDGTAVYYFTQDKLIGFNSLFKELTSYIVSSPLIVIPTWGTLIIQTVIFCALFLSKKYWKYILILALVMHEVFAIMLGLISFSLVMTGLLILFLTPIDRNVRIFYSLKSKYIIKRRGELVQK